MIKSAITNSTGTHTTNQNPSIAKWRPFPELRSVEILQILEELHFPLTELELNKPTPGIVQRIFEGLIVLFIGSTKTDSNSYSNVLSLLEYPELYSDALGLASFYRLASRLMEGVGIDDFSLRDIINPTGVRFRMILSGVINFAKFREEQIATIDGLSSKAVSVDCYISRVESSSLEKKPKVYRHLLSLTREAISTEEPQVAMIEEHIRTLIQNLKEQKINQQQMISSIDALKEEKSILDDKLSISELTTEVDAEKHQIAAFEKNHREALFRADLLHEAISDVQRSLEAMNIALESMQKRSDAELSLSQLSDQESRLFVAMKDAEIKDEQVRRQLSLALERTEKLHASQATRRTLFESSLVTLKAEYEALSRERQVIQEKIDANEHQTKDIETQMSSLKRLHQTDLVNFLTSYKCLRQQIHIYAADLKRSMDASEVKRSIADNGKGAVSNNATQHLFPTHTPINKSPLL